MEKEIKELANQEALAIETFLNNIMQKIPPRDWLRLRLIKVQYNDAHKIITEWKVEKR